MNTYVSIIINCINNTIILIIIVIKINTRININKL